ncbi:Protein of unknown function [Pyronema omphalodes CBS 100304]|uniref:Uncharacterized protein n=1 Tax=Pyronema omphalodes (strain CBS 100304) TaxID=1076935 RepID=U4LVL4_PYROM|nr:Protein of unknown function [Pyronema omphalodes CBS 100304]
MIRTLTRDTNAEAVDHTIFFLFEYQLGMPTKTLVTRDSEYQNVGLRDFGTYILIMRWLYYWLKSDGMAGQIPCPNDPVRKTNFHVFSLLNIKQNPPAPSIFKAN